MGSGYDNYIDKAEVLVEQSDKDRLIELMNEADAILSRYPYSNDYSVHYVTTMSRAKSFVRDTAKWCSYLHTKK